MNSPSVVEEMFLAAVEKATPEERAAFLDAACKDDAELRVRIDRLLAAHFKAANFLEQPVAAAPEQAGTVAPPAEAGSAPTPTTTEYRPDIVPTLVIAGRYTLLEKIGEGGMGEVWVAKQAEPVKRKVAIKLIKAGRDSRAVVQRFEQERQALALMDHPNIARVFDGGLTPTGQPFFVMELVNGLPLTRFCDEAKLSPRDRLELFVPICQAVQHAHQKGIIHRDLKPANILVTLIDGRPVPKVIDFGVAKAATGKLTDATVETHFGAVIGTLEYMAPEQAGFTGQDVDTRADIYSLGVILYELLTGLRPHDKGRMKQAMLAELIRIIKEEEPSKPSTRLSTEESLPSLAAVRQTEPRKLMAMLRGELDWVVMRCLEKQRDRRYETASGLARDVQRYLADETVEARPPSASYRLHKFLRRHKRPVIAAGLLLAALLTGIIGTSWGMWRAWEAESQTAQALEDVTQEQDRTKKALVQVEAEQEKTKEALKAEQQAKRSESIARQEADTNADLAQKRFYANQIYLASEALAAHQPARVLDMLETLRPAQGGKDYRTFEWYYLWHTVNAGLRFTVPGGWDIAYTPDGKLLFAHAGQYVQFLDPQTGKEVFPRQRASDAKQSVACVAASPDGKLLASGTYGGSFDIWDAKTGQRLAAFQEKGSIRGLAWKPDGSEMLLAISHPPRLQFRNGRTFAIQSQFEIPALVVYAKQIAYSPSGQFVACAYEDDGVGIYDVTGPKPALVDHIHAKKPVLATRWSPDGSTLGISLWEEISLWEVAGKRERRRFPGRYKSMDFAADGATLFGANPYRREVVGWDLKTGVEIMRRGSLAPLGTVAADPLGRGWVSAAEKGGIKFWFPPTVVAQREGLDLFRESGRRFGTYPHAEPLLEAGLSAAVPNRKDVPGKAYAFFPDQNVWITLESGEGDISKLHVIEVGSGKLVQTEEFTSGGQVGARVSSQARVPVLITATKNTKRTGSAPPIHVWDVNAGRLSLRRKIQTPTSWSVAVSPDGAVLVAGLLFGGVTAWDTRTGQEIAVLSGRDTGGGYALAVTFSPDGTLVAAGHSGNFIRVWDWPGRRLRATLNGHLGLIETMAFFPDNRTLASSAEDGTILWDLDTGQQRLSLPRERQQLYVSPDGTILYGVRHGIPVEYRSKRLGLEATLDDAAELAARGLALLERKQWVAAEATLRECLALRTKETPDAWTTYNTMSMLGAALLGQKEYAAAEPLLLKGYEGMQAREKTIPPQASARIPEAIERLIDFYTTTDKRDELQKYLAVRTKYSQPKGK